jgi:AMMECR1 domain-containing protein
MPVAVERPVPRSRWPAVHEPGACFVTLSIGISVLGPLQPMGVQDEAGLCASLQPRVDGLLLSWRGHRATFLPAVWAVLPDSRDFVRELRQKAGLPAEFWDAPLSLQRYRSESWQGRAADFMHDEPRR